GSRMSEQRKRGISCAGLDAAFEADEAQASNLILEAQLLQARQQLDEAAARFAQAAEIEERLGDICETKGLTEKAWVHRFSGVRCWALAGNFHDAIVLADAVLAGPNLPERLRRRLREYSQEIRLRRAKSSAGLATVSAEG